MFAESGVAILSELQHVWNLNPSVSQSLSRVRTHLSMLENGNTVHRYVSAVWARTGSDGDVHESLVCFSSFINRRVLKPSEIYFDGLIVLLTCYHFPLTWWKGRDVDSQENTLVQLGCSVQFSQIGKVLLEEFHLFPVPPSLVKVLGLSLVTEN